MRLKSFVFPLCLLVPVALMAATAQPRMPPLRAPQSGFTFPSNLTLNYSVDWRVFPAGVASFHLYQDGDTEQVTVTADTIGAVNLLFRVNDRFQSSFSRLSGCSGGFAKELEEGHRRVNATLNFNYAAGQAVYSEQNLVSKINKRTVSDIPSCVTDSLSAIFYAASQPLVVGHSFSFPLGDAPRTVKVTMKVEGREKVETPAGTFETIRVEPTAPAGVVKNRGNIWIWYTDDSRHIPVQMRARLFWGDITFRLTSMTQK